MNLLKIAVGDSRDGIHLRHRAAVHLHGADRVEGRAGRRHLRGDEHRAFARSKAGSAWRRSAPTRSLPRSPARRSPRPRCSPRSRCRRCCSYDYNPRFAVGVVAGSSVLGMIIPPSAMLIIYSFVAEQSVGDMFLAGVVPGLLLAAAYVVAIWAMGRFTPGFVGGRDADGLPSRCPGREIAAKTLPIARADHRRAGRHLHRLADAGRGRRRGRRWSA